MRFFIFLIIVTAEKHSFIDILSLSIIFVVISKLKARVMILGFTVNRMWVIVFLLVNLTLSAQEFTRQDTLRGSITEERAWWDLKHYDLNVEVFPVSKSISGINTLTYTVLSEGNVLQIDLQSPMSLDKVEQNGTPLKVVSEGAAHFITLQEKQEIGEDYNIVLTFSGKPQEAKNAPWDGGFSWKKDGNGKPFIATSNQGIGASIWWPNKDHAYDEPDNGMTMAFTAPAELTVVGNGRLVKTEDNGNTKTWYWQVVNPINNYGVNINIGDYVNFSEAYDGEKGPLDMDYWVLSENLEKAKSQFKQAPKMMEAFEHWFGPYPFYEDSFKLVEVPYLGMEHQSSVTYGNKYKNGYLGSDLSGTGWGLKFDFIIIHEAGHEWFANNITHIDVADMWIHESFTAYSESLFLDYYYGEEAASEYVIGTRRSIRNDRPLIGTYNVHHEGSGDMYYKGANTLHTLRQLVDDDAKWRDILRGLNKEFYHQTISSEQLENYLSEETGINLTQFWDQYLRTTKIPKLEYKVDGSKMSFRYANVVKGFDMPITISVNGNEKWIVPTEEWTTETFPETIKKVVIKKDFYIESEKL
ncbi:MULTISPECIES: M1 family metallopeptidase [Croceibacter]|uniref:M1 family metallopeptidase n=1 Tax=Croceibacter TaxID=216431 RepID=UPI000C52FBAA|nr:MULTISPECIES: M1 family metallopeptidase [Croceibacter]MBG26039.1 peptidase M1 [Croceibacter sp.]|tara:strand:- start:1304 stop:3052 length:1749 start_codon:yes stop_codon:yes gene_type:complete